MSAHSDQLAHQRKDALVAARKTLAEAQKEHSDSYVRYVRDALAAGWSWARIAKEIEISPSAIRRYWKANRHRAGRLT